MAEKSGNRFAELNQQEEESTKNADLHVDTPKAVQFTKSREKVNGSKWVPVKIKKKLKSPVQHLLEKSSPTHVKETENVNTRGGRVGYKEGKDKQQLWAHLVVNLR